MKSPSSHPVACVGGVAEPVPDTEKLEVSEAGTGEGLIAELQKAKGPSRELDRGVAEATGWLRKSVEGEDDYWKWGDWSWTRENYDHPPNYTGSIDAAMSLVAEHLHVELIRDPIMRHTDITWIAYLHDQDKAGFVAVAGHSDFLAIAICIAALRARAQQQEKSVTAQSENTDAPPS